MTMLSNSLIILKTALLNLILTNCFDFQNNPIPSLDKTSDTIDDVIYVSHTS